MRQLATLVAVLLMPMAAAQSQADLAFSAADMMGEQDWDGPLVALRIQSSERQPDYALAGYATSLDIQTVNATSFSVNQVGLVPEDGGFRESYADTRVQGLEAHSGLDVLIIAVAGALPPSITAQSVAMTTAMPGEPSIQETGYVNSSRPLLSADVSRAIQSTATSAFVRIEGTFAISVWSWNLTIGSDHVATGSMRTNVQRDPLTGRELTADVFEQIAQLTFHDGWLELQASAPLTAFLDRLHVAGSGTLQLNDVRGLLDATPRATTLQVAGSYELQQAQTGGVLYNRFTALRGQASMDGSPVKVPVLDHDAARPGAVVTSPTTEKRSWLTYTGGLAAVMLVAVAMHGPMRGLRYQSIKRRFEERDYLEVLHRIDPYTSRPRFKRNANLLKAVSLLSLNQYREAGLFLGTLGPLDGPDPATQAFLRACAAAGQGMDAEAIQHLTDCFRLEPSYKDEAQTVPSLRGLLPYFELGGSAA